MSKCATLVQEKMMLCKLLQLNCTQRPTPVEILILISVQFYNDNADLFLNEATVSKAATSFVFTSVLTRNNCNETISLGDK